MSRHQLIYTPLEKPAANLRLICFPYAGGGISSYLHWAQHLSSCIELSIVQLPGRGSRIFDTPYRKMEDISKDLSDSINKLNFKRNIFYGHSMGAKVSYEVALALQDSAQYPIHLIASGSTAPNIEYQKEKIHRLADKEFIEKIGQLNGTPQEVLMNPEIIELLLPALRADFEIIETYVNKHDVIQPIPISVFAGDEDEIDLESINAWFELFTENTGIHWIAGNHFFVDNNPADTITTLRKVISQYILR